MKTVIYKARYLGKRPKPDKDLEALRKAIRKRRAQYFKAWSRHLDKLYMVLPGKDLRRHMVVDPAAKKKNMMDELEEELVNPLNVKPDPLTK